MSIHDNHRQRVKTRYETYGLDIFDEHQALELLLFYCIPRRDTNEIAHRLIERFGSFGQVLDASVKDLEAVEGVGHNVALYLKMQTDMYRYYEIHKKKDDVILNTVNECGEYLTKFFRGYTYEAVYLLGMDAKRQVLCCEEVAQGSINAVAISIRNIVNMALNKNVSVVVLAHNHPSGIAVPTPDDIQTTKKIATALNAIDVILIDHIVVSDADYVSMRQSGLYNYNILFSGM